MKAVYYSAFQGPISVENVTDAQVVDGGVVLKVNASGVCRSDWHGWMGHDSDITLPHIPGHELVGEIVALGKGVKNWSLWERVTLPFVGGCGKCSYCMQGDHQVCPDQFQPGFTHWGSFAEFVTIHYADTNLVRLPDEIEDTTAASLGCRFATSFRGIVDQAQIKEGQWIAIFGCGGVGLSAIMIAKAKGAIVIAIDIEQKKLNFAKQLGADFVIDGTSTNIVDAIISLSNGGVHISLDALGNQQVINNAIASLRRKGKHIQIGLLTPQQSNSPIAMNRVIAYELEIIGSHGMQSYRYQELLNMILDKKLDPKLLVQNTIKLEDAPYVLESMNSFRGIGIQMIDMSL